jgi:ribosomal protein S18 acetylase RimI-like enzyme
MFTSTEMAARIERADCRLLTDAATAIRDRRGVDVFLVEIAGGVAAYTVENSPFNKLAGLGFGGPVDVAELEAVECAFAERGAALQVELSSLAEPSVGALLSGRGYVLQGFENVLGRSLPGDSPAAVPEGIEIAPIEMAEFETWLDVVVTGFATPDTQGVPSHESFPRDVLGQVIRDMVSAGGFTLLLARRGGEPAGGASMRVCDGVAHMCGAATLPEHRRRGIQTALLSERLRAAGSAGCDLALVTTQPGSKSQQNVQRHGFELLYARAMLVRDS